MHIEEERINKLFAEAGGEGDIAAQAGGEKESAQLIPNIPHEPPTVRAAPLAAKLTAWDAG